VIRKKCSRRHASGRCAAAAALVALEDGPKRLHVDPENAQLLAQGLHGYRTFVSTGKKFKQHRLLMSVRQDSLRAIFEAFAERKVLGGPVDTRRIRMVTPPGCRSKRQRTALRISERSRERVSKNNRPHPKNISPEGGSIQAAIRTKGALMIIDTHFHAFPGNFSTCYRGPE